MVKKQLLYRAAAATVLGLSLATGAASAQTPFQHYKNHHGNQVPTQNTVTLSSTNQQNNVVASNTATQVAQSGDATVTGNHHAGDADAGTGNAANGSDLTNAEVTVKNTTPVTAGDNAPVGGDNSDANTNTVNVSSTDQQNNVGVTNNVDQYANTGDAVVAHNGQGGSAKTGNATNTSNASFNVTVTN